MEEDSENVDDSPSKKQKRSHDQSPSAATRADEKEAERTMGLPFKKRNYMRMAHTSGEGRGDHEQKTSTDVKPKSHEQNPIDVSTESVKREARNVIGTPIAKKPRTRPRVGVVREHSQPMEQGHTGEPSPTRGTHDVGNVNPKPVVLHESKKGALEVPSSARKPSPILRESKKGVLEVPSSARKPSPIGSTHKAKGIHIGNVKQPEAFHDQIPRKANPIGTPNKGKSINLTGYANPTPKPPVQGQGNKEGGGGDPAFPSSVTTDIKVDGFSLCFLFRRELTHNEIANKVLIIPRSEAERHFPTLKNPDGSYKEEILMVSDALLRRWLMKIKFSRIAESYMIAGDWREYISTYGLQAKDVVRVFKVVRPVPVKHYFIDFARAGEEAGTRKSQSDRDRPGEKEGGGGGSSSKERGFSSARDKGISIASHEQAQGH